MGDRQIQRYALDANGDVVDVRNMPDKGASVFCPHCRDSMIPKTGKIRAWHFAHKVRPCAYNSYLHSLAKIRIAEWFNRSASIILDMEASGVCADRENCAFYDPVGCSRPARMRHDLKKYYPTCEIERGYRGFVPDILCPRQTVPLFIEILVTHECSEEKRTSGNRIIELVIDSEESIDKIVSSPVIRESKNARLYGFRRTEMSYGNLQKSLVKYTLYRSGKSHVSEETVHCRNYQNRHPSAIYEITAGADIDPVLMYLAGKSMAHREGLLPKDCSICFWLGGTPGARICKLYRKCGNPMWCEDNDAAKCPMFRENMELVEECLAICDSFGVPDIWRRQ